MRLVRIAIAGLDPAIHHLSKKVFYPKEMDARIKSGHDVVVQPEVIAL